jgi:uncharacterized protein YlxW (UPF0749 family)
MLILWAIDRLWDALVFVLQVVWGVVTLKPFRKRKTPRNLITMSKSETEERYKDLDNEIDNYNNDVKRFKRRK